jgi:glycosyltransferase involved in cell wall biosynthesis
LTTLEALSCGTKAIVYKDTACQEVAEKYGGISVEYENIEEIVKNIKNICE